MPRRPQHTANVPQPRATGTRVTGSRSRPPNMTRIAHPPGVNLSGFFSSEKGVGEAARSDVRSLRAAGVPFVLHEEVDLGSENSVRVSGRRTTDSPYDVNLIHMNADQLLHFHDRRGRRYFEGRYNIGCWAWELEDFPLEW